MPLSALRVTPHCHVRVTSTNSQSQPGHLCLVSSSFVKFRAMSYTNSPKINFSDKTTHRTVHEATLQDLLRARNYATLQLLKERNELLCER